MRIQPIVHQGETLVYVVNYKDDKGWLVVSGDKRTPAILAYSATGSFDLKSLNPGAGTWTDDLAERIFTLKNNHTTFTDTLNADYILWNRIGVILSNTQTQPLPLYGPGGPINPPSLPYGWWQLSHITTQPYSGYQVGPLLPTKWGQGSPWNTCVPETGPNSGVRCPTGCVAVAAAQMLYYLQYYSGSPPPMYSTGYCSGWSIQDPYFPNIQYSYSFSNPNTATWSLMALSSWNVTVDATDRVAVLMGWIGFSIGMKYQQGESGTQTQKLVSFFSSLGIQCDYTDYNSSKIVPSLDNNMPVIVRAARDKKDHTFLDLWTWYTTYGGAHAWVIDGYEAEQTKYFYHYEWVTAPYDGGPQILVGDTYTEESIGVSQRYLIMNWGYDGGYDSGRYYFDGEWTTTSDRNYEFERKMIYNFR